MLIYKRKGFRKKMIFYKIFSIAQEKELCYPKPIIKRGTCQRYKAPCIRNLNYKKENIL